MLHQTQNQPNDKGFKKRFTGASDDPVIEAQLDALLKGIYYLHHKEIDLGLDRTYRFLNRIGNPHLKLPKVVHIAGTNGKGSTTATLRSLLETSGHKVHVYTSPHLVHPTERIRLAGNPIGSQAFIDLLQECIAINDGEPITFFELTTCAALLAFTRVKADFLLLETGMGGRLDTTNVVPNPACTIITSISYDHMSFLGNTLSKIAYEKAGIMKAQSPCVIGYQFEDALKEGVMDVFHKQSQSLSTPAPLLHFGAEWVSAPESNDMMFRYEDDSIRLPRPNLLGIHQIWNAGAALAAFRIIAPKHFKPEILSTALTHIDWPARLQTLENHVFKALTPPDWDIVLDGAHNDTAGQILALQMGEWGQSGVKPVHMIVGMMARKDAAAFLKPLLGHIFSLTFVPVLDGEGECYSSEKLAGVATSLGFENIYIAPSPQDAIQTIVERAKTNTPARIVIAGSLYLAGNVLDLE